MREEERVFGVPREGLFFGDPFHGFRSEGLAAILERIGARGTFRERAAVEDDPAWKQIIPYAVLCAGSKVLLLRRKGTQTEARLHRKASIGVGGHINPAEETAVGSGSAPLERALRILEAGLRRELAEELLLPRGAWAEPVGCLNDYRSEVGRVHFGIVYRLWVPEPAVPEDGGLVREVELMEGRLVDRAELRRHLPEMESWSQLILEAVLGWPSGGEACGGVSPLGAAARIAVEPPPASPCGAVPGDRRGEKGV